MKNYPIIPLPAALACLISACATGGLSLAVIIITSFIPGLKLPFTYYEALNIPVLSVLFPIIGMVLLTPIALYLAFKREAPLSAGEKTDVEKQEVEEPEAHFLKAA